MISRKKWKEIYNENNESHKKRNSAVFLAIITLVIVILGTLSLRPEIEQSELVQQLNRIIEKSGMTAPEGSRIVIEFYNDNNEFTGEKFIITENGIIEYDGGAYDVYIATKLSYIPLLQQGDLCEILQMIYLQNDYIYEERGDVSKYSYLESCIK